MTSTLITKGIRTRLKKAMADKPVTAAVAYVSNVEGLPLGAGDTVVCDASKHTALMGSTRKDVLLELVTNKVKVWSVEGLHAKVVVAGKKAFVGSANWSQHSDKKLEEAVIETDDPDVVAAVTDYVVGLAAGAIRVDKAYIKTMPDPPPTNGPGGVGKPRHWLVSMCDLSEKLEESASLALDPHKQKLSDAMDGGAEIRWCRLTPSSYLGKRVKAGDWITASWREEGHSPTAWPPCLVVDNLVFEKHRGIFYRQDAGYDDASVAWKTFRKKALQLGMPDRITETTDTEIEQATADALRAWWEERLQKRQAKKA